MYRLNIVSLLGLGILSGMPVFGWNIAIENQTDTDMRCRVLPRVDVGARLAVSQPTLNMIAVPAKQNSQLHLPVWQENLNPYIVLVLVPPQKPMSWLVELKAHSQLRVVSVGADQLTLYSRINDQQWAKVDKRVETDIHN